MLIANVAVTVVLAVTVTAQVPVPIAEPEQPTAPDYRPLAAEVAAILNLDAEPLLAIVERARSQGWYVSEIVDEAKTFAAGGERPEWLTQ